MDWILFHRSLAHHCSHQSIRTLTLLSTNQSIRTLTLLSTNQSIRTLTLESTNQCSPTCLLHTTAAPINQSGRSLYNQLINTLPPVSCTPLLTSINQALILQSTNQYSPTGLLHTTASINQSGRSLYNQLINTLPTVSCTPLLPSINQDAHCRIN